MINKYNLLIMVVMLLFSCGKDEGNLEKDNNDDNGKKCYVGEVVSDAGSSTTFDYNSDMNITKLEDKEGEDLMKMIYTYNSDGLMNSMVVYTDYGDGLEEDGTTMFTYNDDNKITSGKITIIEDGEAIITNISYVLDKDNNLKNVTATMIIPDVAYEIEVKTEFVFEEGNLIDFKEYGPLGKLTGHVKYKYDNKNNPFYNLGNKYSVINAGHEMWGSKNNVISEEVLVSNTFNSTETYNYEYEYNDNNYPEKAVSDWETLTLNYLKCE